MSDQIFEVNCGFFDSVNKDRLYSADEMNRPYKRVITNGVFATPQGTPSTDLQVLSASDGMNIIVKAGEGLFGDKWFENAADIAITVPTNTSTVPRRDSVIVQVDKRLAGRKGRVIYRTGTPNSNPMPPDLSTTNNVIEYRVANIYVSANAVYIGQDAITDLRGSSECPWVTSLIKQVDTSTLFAQWQAAYQNYYNTSTVDFEAWQAQEQAEFEAWLQDLTEQLTVNTNIVNYESHYTSTTDGETVIPINIENYNPAKDVLYVYVNRLRATPTTDYTIASDGSSITLTKDIKANQSVDFLVLQSVIVGDNQTVLELLQQLQTTITGITTDSGWTNFTLESGATAYDDTTKPAVRKYNNQVFIRGAIKGLDTVGSPICTLPTNMRPAMNKQYPVTAFADGTIAANCVIEITTAGIVKLVAKSGTIPATAMLPISTEFIVG